MATNPVRIAGRFSLSRSGSETPISIKDAEDVVNQWRRDALQGSFAPTAHVYKDHDWEVPRHEISDTRYVDFQHGSSTDFRFELELNNRYFPIESGGLQHLIGVASGDLFFESLGGLHVDSFRIVELHHPQIGEKLDPNTRRFSRSNFCLGQHEPLLAFSIKPRVGLKPSSVEKVALGILREGFHVVEMDTREIILDSHHLKWLLDLSKKAANLEADHVTRFSPNLTMSSAKIVDTAKQFADVHDGKSWMVKVDGGLDGLSAVNELRSVWPRQREDGLTITSYPFLRKPLDKWVPSDFMNRALACAGTDVLYAGGRPSFPSPTRQIDTSVGLHNSIRRYQAMLRAGHFLPTIAGGIRLGEIHAYLDLLGQDAAFFLGGAIAAHKQGPIEGARTCVKIVKEAVADLARPDSKRRRHLSDGLILEVENSYPEEHSYISPKKLRQDDPILDSLCRDNP